MANALALDRARSDSWAKAVFQCNGHTRSAHLPNGGSRGPHWPEGRDRRLWRPNKLSSIRPMPGQKTAPFREEEEQRCLSSGLPPRAQIAARASNPVTAAQTAASPPSAWTSKRSKRIGATPHTRAWKGAFHPRAWIGKVNPAKTPSPPPSPGGRGERFRRAVAKLGPLIELP